MLKIINYKGTRPLNTSKRAHITGNTVNGIVTAIYEVRGVGERGRRVITL